MSSQVHQLKYGAEAGVVVDLLLGVILSGWASPRQLLRGAHLQMHSWEAAGDQLVLLREDAKARIWLHAPLLKATQNPFCGVRSRSHGPRRPLIRWDSGP